MTLLGFFLAIAQAFRDMPADVLSWLHDRLFQLADVPGPILIVVAVVSFAVALAAIRTRPARR
jgi:hypothetical protein